MFWLIKDLELERITLREWPRDSYFESEKHQDFSNADIGTLLNVIMQYRPLDRPRAIDILNHVWFDHQRENTKSCNYLVDVQG